MKLSISKDQYDPLRANRTGEFSFWPGGGIVYQGRLQPVKNPIRGLWPKGTGSHIPDKGSEDHYEYERPNT